MSEFTLRPMRPEEWSEVAELIYVSTNFWYQIHGRPPIFTGPPESTQVFCRIYEALDPGCCLVAVSHATGRIAGSCFYHPRETHVSLGIMNAHPNYFRQGVASRLLQAIVAFAEKANKPLRLVSSAINLDSFSLYNRAGFVPRTIYQDMQIAVPPEGIAYTLPKGHRIRAATLEDVPVMADLEREIAGIRREKDYRYFVENTDGCWHVSVLETEHGTIEGFMTSVATLASNMLGPGVARTQEQAAALIAEELNQHRGRNPVVLVPSQADTLVHTLYGWGARNCELHFAQIRGPWQEPKGLLFPTFLPETG
ncbi:acetyltransferase [Chthonomonas calidirosea]|uniref:GNAT family N-acetyltransferase n=1 Tax=Chthonomonas calidirosea TaxID=454171 RepID=UPI0006DD44A9|nr:GNAT family N-acetyltransferase [Chthonomonas calidirosea]CEK17960.1 acetyltransferase [Chthonomonas calidirosea]